ncbi:OB-fold protein [Flagellimonas sp. 2504JD4-2]
MMSKKTLTISFTILIACVLAFMGYKYLNPGQRNIVAETARYELSANDLFSGFSKDGNTYIDQVLLTSGQVTEIDKNSVTLDNKVQVNFIDAPLSKVEKGSHISIKGRCIGYDDLLELVKIDQATITN